MSDAEVERIYPKPVFPPTPESDVHIVVLGGIIAGVYTLAT